MDSSVTSEILEYFLPYVVRAGEYAKAVQARVASQPDKTQFADQFGQALTDADLSVQCSLEVASLAKFPNIRFVGEEIDSSYNAKYFASESEVSILVDPIDGTRFYADGRSRFNVILSVVSKEAFLGTILAIPRWGKVFTAIRGQGARITTCEQALAGDFGDVFEFGYTDEELPIITYRQRELHSALEGMESLIDIFERYDRDIECPSVISSLLLDEAVAVIGAYGGLIDWGAMAFIAEEAGAVCTDFSGVPLPALTEVLDERYPEIVVSRDRRVHDRILDRLARRD